MNTEHTNQPRQAEPVNQQLLDALSEATRLIAEISIAATGCEVTEERIDKVVRIAREGSAVQRFRDMIAAAEQAQQAEPVALSEPERKFLEFVYRNPGCKCDCAWGDEGPLWPRLEELGLIRATGSYKWECTPAVSLSIAAQPPAVADNAAKHAAQYRWLLENCIQEDENGWAVLHFETARHLKTHPQIVEWMDGDIESAMLAAAPQAVVAVPDGVLSTMRRASQALDASSCHKMAAQLREANHLLDTLAAAPQGADPIKRLIAMHNELLGEYPYCYFELAYTRRTDWMAWLCTKPREDDPERKVLACGQGLTAEEACAEAISAAQKGGEA